MPTATVIEQVNRCQFVSTAHSWMHRMEEIESLGEFFRELREKRNCSLEEAAKATRIKPENLAAIESDQITKSVPIVYATSFVKAYADFLGADGATVAERFRRLHAEAFSRSQSLPTSAMVTRPKIHLSRLFSRRVLAVLSVIAAAVAVYSLHSLLSKPCKVTVVATGHLPIKVYRDGRFVLGTIIGPGETESWSAKTSVELKITKAENAKVIYRGREAGLPKKGAVSIFIDRRGIRTTQAPQSRSPVQE